MSTPATATIDGRTYTVAALPTPALTASDLASRGWEPQAYMLTGKRGATFMGYRDATTGAFARVGGAS